MLQIDGFFFILELALWKTAKLDIGEGGSSLWERERL